jgi:putative sugar O-methyltransferase
MKLRLKHLRHPFQAGYAAKTLVAGRWNMRRFADRGERHFASDPRYDLQSVTDGFAVRMDDRSSDPALLERICTSYIKAAKQQQIAPAIYRATEWWEQQQKWSLKPIMQALMARDVAAVGGMYRNFYRDPCSAGLIALQSISKDYFGETIKDFHRRLYLIDALYRIDYWKARTGGCFTLGDLSGPSIGNPFGVVIEGTLVRAGAEYQHYCAHRISGLLDSKTATVVEIGGGFGGMAYYLLRDRPGTTYVDFDVPESIALTSYYLLKAFPQLSFLLYGEEELTKEAISRADVVLMPAFELAGMPAGSVDVTFSSHAMSDLSHGALVDYLKNIANMTRNYFVYIGNGPSGRAICELVEQRYPPLKLAETRPSGWHDHKIQGISEVECLYRICGA